MCSSGSEGVSAVCFSGGAAGFPVLSSDPVLSRGVVIGASEELQQVEVQFERKAHAIVTVCPLQTVSERANRLHFRFAPLAQLDRASGYEPGGRRFESCRAHQFPQQLRPVVCAVSLRTVPNFVPTLHERDSDSGPDALSASLLGLLPRCADLSSASSAVRCISDPMWPYRLAPTIVRRVSCAGAAADP